MMLSLHWYALKVFHNRFDAVQRVLARDGVQNYLPTKKRLCTSSVGRVGEKEVPLVAMLMFLRCDEEYIKEFAKGLSSLAMVYGAPGTRVPCPISDAEMDSFILLTTARQEHFDIRPYDTLLLRGDRQRYRIVEGACSGIEGYYKRIDKDHRFIVPLGNLLMLVSRSYIPKRHLQSIESI